MSPTTLVAAMRAEARAFGRILRLRGIDLERHVTAEGWTVRDVTLHLVETDLLAASVLAARAGTTSIARAPVRPDGLRTDLMLEHARASLTDLVSMHESASLRLTESAGKVAVTQRVTWGPATLSAENLLRARLMEHWAHGLDVARSIDVRPTFTARGRHVAELAFRARLAAFTRVSRTLPGEDLYLYLSAPGGDSWQWGNPESPHRVEGRAEQFCYVAVRRLAARDSGLGVSSECAAVFLDQVQAFGGPLAG